MKPSPSKEQEDLNIKNLTEERGVISQKRLSKILEDKIGCPPIEKEKTKEIFTALKKLMTEDEEQKKKIKEATKSTLKEDCFSLKFISEIEGYFEKQPPKKPVLLEYTKDEDMSGKKIPFLNKEIVAQLIAEGGRGKTYLCVLLALCIVMDVPFLSKFQVKQTGGVCLILGENDDEDIQRILYKIYFYLLKEIEKNKTAPDHTKFPTHPQAIEKMVNWLCPVSVHGKNANFIDNEGNETPYYKNLLEELIRKEPDENWQLIIIDPASRFMGGKSETDNGIATKFIACLEKISASLRGKPTVLMSHHKSKAGTNENIGQIASRGASALPDGSRWQASISKDPYAEDDSVIIFEIHKTNFTPPLQKFRIKKNLEGIPEFDSWVEPKKASNKKPNISKGSSTGDFSSNTGGINTIG